MIVYYGTDNQDYTTKFYSISGTTLTLIPNSGIIGTLTTTPVPQISYSSKLDIILIYGKSDPSTYFLKGKKIDWTASTVSDLTYPAKLTTT